MSNSETTFEILGAVLYVTTKAEAKRLSVDTVTSERHPNISHSVEIWKTTYQGAPLYMIGRSLSGARITEWRRTRQRRGAQRVRAALVQESCIHLGVPFEEQALSALGATGK